MAAHEEWPSEQEKLPLLPPIRSLIPLPLSNQRIKL